MIYNEGQFNEVVPLLPRYPKWFILGGPSDGNEAQCAKKLFPDINVIGVEPNKKAIAWQLENGWPDIPSKQLIKSALWNEIGVGALLDEELDLRHASLDPARKGERTKTLLTTLDSLDEIFGPFDNAILWLDIEGAELEALQGAKQCLARNAFILINIEFLHRNATKNKQIEELLNYYGFRLVHTWGECETHEDRIYVK